MDMENQLDLSTIIPARNENSNNIGVAQVSPRSEAETPRSGGPTSPRQSFLGLGLLDRQKQLEKVHELFSSSFSRISSSVEKGVESYQDKFRNNNAFRNWTKDEMIRRLVRDGVEIRDEANISEMTLQNMMDEFYRDKKYPKKTRSIYFNNIEKVERAVRTIQNAWISRKCKLRVALERHQQENNDEDEDNELYETTFGDVNWDNVGTLNSLYPNSPSRFETSVHDTGGFTALNVASSPVAGARSPNSPTSPSSPTVGVYPSMVDENDLSNRNSYVNNKVQKALDKKWIPPSWSGAKRTAALYHPSRGGREFPYYRTTTGRHCTLGGCGEQCDMWKEGRVSQLAPYGPGITNYFKFIKWSFWVFLVAFFITLPTLILNSQANSNGVLPLYGTDALAVLSIGNLINYLGKNKTSSSSSSSTFLLQLLQCDIGYGFDCILTPQLISYLYVSTDLLLCIMLFFGFLWIQHFEKREEMEVDRPFVQISEFSIKVTNLPSACTSKELYAHFNKLLHNSYPIVDIELASNNRDEIHYCLLRGKCVHERAQLIMQYRYMRHLIRIKHHKNDKSSKETSVTSSTDTTGPAGDAVDASSPPAVRPISTEAPSTAAASTPTVPPPLTRSQSHHQLTPAAEKEIRELNNEFVTKCRVIDLEIFKHEKMLSDFDNKNDSPQVAYIVFNDTLGAQIAVDRCRLQLEDWTSNSQDQCLQLRGKRLHVTPAPEPNTIIWENEYVRVWHKAGRRALSTALAFLLVLVSVGMIIWTHVYTPTSNLNQSVVVIFTAFIVSLCNLAIGYTLQYCSQYEQYSDMESREMSVFIRSFMLKYINSGLAFLVVGSSSSYYSTIFTFTWYQTVGAMIVLVQIFDTCLPQCMPIISYFRHRYSIYKTKKIRKTILTQKELNKRLLGPEHYVALRYSHILSTYFVALTFSTGLPILNAIVFVHMVCFYFLEKYFYFRLYRSPEWRYTTKVGNWVTSLLPYGILIHLAMSIWTFTKVNAVLTTSAVAVSASPWNFSVLQTASYEHTFPLFCLFFVIVIVLLTQYFSQLVQSTFTRTSAFLCKKESKWYEDSNNWDAYEKQYKDRYILWSNKIGGGKGYRMITGGLTRAIQRNLVKGLVSYNMLKNLKYKELFALSSKFLKKHSQLNKIRFDKIDSFQAADDNGNKRKSKRRVKSMSSRSDSNNVASPPLYDIFNRRRTSPASSNGSNNGGNVSSPASSLHGANIITNSNHVNNHANPLATRSNSRTNSNASYVPLRCNSNISANGDDCYSGSPRSEYTADTELMSALSASVSRRSIHRSNPSSTHGSTRTPTTMTPQEEDGPAPQPAPAISATSAANAVHTSGHAHANRNTTVRFSEDSFSGHDSRESRESGGIQQSVAISIDNNGNVIPYYPTVEAVLVEASVLPTPQTPQNAVISVEARPL